MHIPIDHRLPSISFFYLFPYFINQLGNVIAKAGMCLWCLVQILAYWNAIAFLAFIQHFYCCAV